MPPGRSESHSPSRASRVTSAHMDCHSEQAGLNLLNSRGITHAGHHSMVKAKRIVILDGYVAHG